MTDSDFKAWLKIKTSELLRSVNRVDDRHTEEGIELGARAAWAKAQDEIAKKEVFKQTALGVGDAYKTLKQQADKLSEAIDEEIQIAFEDNPHHCPEWCVRLSIKVKEYRGER